MYVCSPSMQTWIPTDPSVIEVLHSTRPACLLAVTASDRLADDFTLLNDCVSRISCFFNVLMAPKVVERKGTQLLHADSALRRGGDVAPAISVSTSTHYVARCVPSDSFFHQHSYLVCQMRKKARRITGFNFFALRTIIVSRRSQNPSRHVYSRYTTQTSTRVEHILSQITVIQSLRYRDQVDDSPVGWVCLDLLVWSGG